MDVINVKNLYHTFDGSNYILKDISTRELNELYRKNFDFIFQDINLIPVLNVEENIELKNSLIKKKTKYKRIRRNFGSVKFKW